MLLPFPCRRALLLLSLATLSLFSPCRGQLPIPQAHPSSSSTAETELLRRARAADVKGDDSTAAPLFLEVLRRTPSSYEANESLGLIYADSADYAKALPYFKKAAQIAPRESVAHANLGAALLQLGMDSEASGELLLASHLNSHDAGVEANLGRVLFKTGKPAEAAKHFATAAALAPADSELLYNWAVALDATDPGNAEAVLARIAAAEATDESESLYGDVEEKLGHYKEAVEHLRHAAELVPSEPNIYALAVELLRHWSWQAAAKVCNFGLSRYPASSRITVALGVAQYGNGIYPAAAETFSKLLAAHPEDAVYADMLGRSCDFIVEKQSQDCEQLQGFADSHPSNAQIDIHAASSILHLPQAEQDLARADRLLEAAILSDPKASEAFYQLGVLDQRTLRWKESVAHLERAIALRPSFAAAHYRLARAYFHLGDKVAGNQQIAMQRQYQAQEKEELDRKLKDVTRLIFSQP